MIGQMSNCGMERRFKQRYQPWQKVSVFWTGTVTEEYLVHKK